MNLDKLINDMWFMLFAIFCFSMLVFVFDVCTGVHKIVPAEKICFYCLLLLGYFFVIVCVPIIINIFFTKCRNTV